MLSRGGRYNTDLLDHASHAFARGYKVVIIHGPDTDMAVLCAANAPKFSGILYFITEVQKNFRIIDVSVFAEECGQLADVLPALHVFTGADATSTFAGIGNKMALDVARSCTDFLDETGESFDCSEGVFRASENFIAALYNKTRCDNASADLETLHRRMP